MNYHKGENMICVTKDEYEKYYRETKIEEMLNRIARSKYSLSEILEDRDKQLETIKGLDKIPDKESIEFFISFFSLTPFYGEDSQVCLFLKDSINIKHINSFGDIIPLIKENSISDFGIFSKSEFRKFQLKQYRGITKTKDFYAFLEKVLQKYGYDLGNTNLLIILQGNIDVHFEEMNIDFKDISERVKSLPLKGDFGILVSYNDNNIDDKIITVYPELGISSIPMNKIYKTKITDIE